MTTKISRPAKLRPTPKSHAPDATSTRPTRQEPIPTLSASGGLSDTPAAIPNATPSDEPPQGANTRPTKVYATPNSRPSGGPNDTPAASAVATPIQGSPQGANTRPTITGPIPTLSASGGSHTPAATEDTTPMEAAPQGTTTSRQSKSIATPKAWSTDGTPTTGGQSTTDAQLVRAAGTTSRQEPQDKTLQPSCPDGTPTTGGHASVDTHRSHAAGTTSDREPGDQTIAHSPPGRTSATGGHVPIDTRGTGAAGSYAPGQEANVPARPMLDSLLDPALSLGADILDDLERVRIANENRLRQLTRTEVDADGQERGFGLDESHPDVAQLAAMVAALRCDSRVLAELGYPKPSKERGKVCCLEHGAELNLRRKMRKHPLGPWLEAQRGVGEKQGARLLAAIGDPYIRPALFDEDGTLRSPEGPRTVSALWAYAGLHVLRADQSHSDAHVGAVSPDQPPAGQAADDTHVGLAGGAQLPAGHNALDTQRPDAGRNELPASQSSCDTQDAPAGGAKHRDTDHPAVDTQPRYVGVAAKRRKGVRANWSGTAKMRAHLVAKSCLKQIDAGCEAGPFEGRWLAVHHPSGPGGHAMHDTQRAPAAGALNDRAGHYGPDTQWRGAGPAQDAGPGGQTYRDAQVVSAAGACPCSPYRVVYDLRRVHTSHTHPDWSDGHHHNDALRVASKAILRDLWLAAYHWHQQQTGGAG